MLKAGSIQLRVSGKDITVFGESAVAAMGNNNAFGKISISLNTDGTLTVPELLNAAKILMGVLGAPRTAPVKDQIAQAANKRIKYLMTKWNKLVPNFEHLHLAGLHQLNKAIVYGNRILDSEGGEAAICWVRTRNARRRSVMRWNSSNVTNKLASWTVSFTWKN